LIKKKPWEYYEDAKYCINKQKWLDAKTNLLHYRAFVENKSPVISDTNDEGIKKPADDSHLKYLAYVQDQLNAQDKEEPDPILSRATGKANRYTRQWEDWQKTYMQKK